MPISSSFSTFPPFSVLLSDYNCTRASHLSQCLTSIWDSQSLKPSQIVLVLDGPISPSLSTVIKLWKTKINDVLYVIPIPFNFGLANALNVGLTFCQYELIARIDSDDVSLSSRFEQQIKFMSLNPFIDVSSGYVEECTSDLSIVLSTRKLPLSHSQICKFARFRNPISHPAAVFKKSAVLSVGGYPSIYPEDFPLWGLLISRGFQFANIDSILVRMRIEDSINSRRGIVFLLGQLRCFMLFRKIGLFGWFQFLFSSLVIVLLRCSPSFVRKLLYSYVR